MKAADYALLVIAFIIILIIIFVTRKGSVEDDIEENYKELYDINAKIGAAHCQAKKMQYIGVTSEDGKEFDVFCYLKSPCKTYRFSLQ